jgi:hypothetical protein
VIDWDALVATANAWHAGPFVYATLHLARDVLGADVPDATLETLDHDAHDDEIVAVANRYILTPAVDVPDSMVEIQRTRGWSHRFSLFLRSVFLPPERLREIHGLEPDSAAVWLFYPVRIVDLVRRSGGLLARLVTRSEAVRPVRGRENDRRRIQHWAGYDDARALADHAPPSGPPQRTRQ